MLLFGRGCSLTGIFNLVCGSRRALVAVDYIADETCWVVFARGRGVLSWSLLERRLLMPLVCPEKNFQSYYYEHENF